MSLTSDELNFLIYRYLRECGFEHSAYAFGHESFVFKSTIDTAAVSPGALISFVQKGLQYTDIEAHLSADGTEIICDEPLSVTKQHTCRVKQKRRLFDAFDPVDNDYGSAEIDTAIRVQTTQRSQRCMTTAIQWHPHTNILAVGGADGSVRVWEFKEQNEQIYDNSNGAETEADAPRKKHKPYSLITTLPTNDARDSMNDVANTTTTNNDNSITVDAAANENGDSDDKSLSVKRQRISEDASMPPMPPSDTEPPLNISITVVEWHQRGSLIAGGSYDGRVFIWNAKNHSLLHTLIQHTAPVTAIRFTHSANTLLSASVDGSVANWDVNTGALLSVYRLHDGPVLDCDTSPVSDTTWVSCGTNGNLFLYEQSDAHNTDTRNTNGAELSRQQRRLSGHSGDVNSVRFDASGTLMASGGDDCVVRVWNVQTAVCNHALHEHQRAITCVRWSIHEQQTSAPSTLLASASLDCTANVYEVDSGKLLFTLNKHAQPITAISFQPGNALICTASHERVHIWSLGTTQQTSDDENVLSGGTLVKTFRSDGVGGLIDCCWDHVGRRIAVASTDKCTFVIDLSTVIRLTKE